MDKELELKLNSLTRDFTKVGIIRSKSEVNRMLLGLLQAQKEEILRGLPKENKINREFSLEWQGFDKGWNKALGQVRDFINKI